MENEKLAQIADLKNRLVSIQDRFIQALITHDGEGTAEQVKGIAGAISWATSSEYMLSVLRVQIRLQGTQSGAQVFPDNGEHTVTPETVQEVLSMIQKQVEDTESSLNRIEAISVDSTQE